MRLTVKFGTLFLERAAYDSGEAELRFIDPIFSLGELPPIFIGGEPKLLFKLGALRRYWEDFKSFGFYESLRESKSMFATL